MPQLVVPGDFSAAAFFIVGATIVPGSDVTIQHVGINPTRTGLLDVMMNMGADIQLLNRREEAGEPVADIRVKSARLHGVAIGPDLIPRTIDEFPILCVAAAVAEGETIISGAEELRVKESDRIATVSAELRAMGAQITEKPDGMVVRGLGTAENNGRLQAARGRSHGDHRVAMSLAIAGLTASAPTVIDETACIETSFPDFHHTTIGIIGRAPVTELIRSHDMGSIAEEKQASRLIVAIDGPAGVGKSTVAKLLASRLGYLYLDTGALYRAMAWAVIESGRDPADAEAVAALLPALTLQMQFHHGAATVLVNGRDVTGDLRTPAVSAAASVVSAIPAVRAWLLPIQRTDWEGRGGGGGRAGHGDEGLPFCRREVFSRSRSECSGAAPASGTRCGGTFRAIEETSADLTSRDTRDRSRSIAPLAPAEDARHIDTSNLSATEVVDQMMAVIAAKL